jgi:hypothetical protein
MSTVATGAVLIGLVVRAVVVLAYRSQPGSETWEAKTCFAVLPRS